MACGKKSAGDMKKSAGDMKKSACGMRRAIRNGGRNGGYGKLRIRFGAEGRFVGIVAEGCTMGPGGQRSEGETVAAMLFRGKMIRISGTMRLILCNTLP